MKIWIANALNKLGMGICRFAASIVDCKNPCLAKARDNTHIICGYVSDDGRGFLGGWNIDLNQKTRDAIRDIIL